MSNKIEKDSFVEPGHELADKSVKKLKNDLERFHYEYSIRCISFDIGKLAC